MSSTAAAHPSLALAKYWGKRHDGLPETPSVAVTLDTLTSTATAQKAEADSVILDNTKQNMSRFLPVLHAIRSELKDNSPQHANVHFAIHARNNFPTAAGLASSSSGFAALTAACFAAVHTSIPDKELLSRTARIGSGSACRSVFGGFTRWDAGSASAQQILPADWWKELRVIIAVVTQKPKEISSRNAMALCKDTSAYYRSWVTNAKNTADEVEQALNHKDIERLGSTAQRSAMNMFACMIAAEPPIIYWLPASLAIIHTLRTLRKKGIPAWETMDAGPQVKVITTMQHCAAISREIQEWSAAAPIICSVGEGVHLT